MYLNLRLRAAALCFADGGLQAFGMHMLRVSFFYTAVQCNLW